MNLQRISWLREISKFVGFSDHSNVASDGVIAAKAAMTFGINSVERHFTNLKPEETKDGPVSINFQQLKELVDFSKLSMDDKLSSLKEENANWIYSFKRIFIRSGKNRSHMSDNFYA